MPAHRHREEAINTQLALLLARYGVDAESETIQAGGRQRPDVLFALGGLRVILEGKFADVHDAEAVVLRDAQKRLESGICHLAVAIVYPPALRTTATAKLGEVLETAPLRVQVFAENGATDWTQATPAELLAILRRVQEQLIDDDIVAKAAKALAERIDAIALFWLGQSATAEKLARVLGMPAKRGETPDERDGRQAMAIRVAALVLANALIFQEQLAASGGDARLKSLRAYDGAEDPISAIQTHWNWIWTKINYVPIFQIGETILAELPVSPAAMNAVRQLIAQAKSICANQSALRHDLMGRIYHWLLHHAKYLGTYYTSVSAATLLLKLTFAQDWPEVDFGDPGAVVDFTVADLACGTGTLLMAAGQAIADRFVEARAGDGRPLAENYWVALHAALMENTLYGYDVLPSAVHLTASTLGMLSPHVTYRKMNLYIMPMGLQGDLPRLGSLEFIATDRVPTQLSLDRGASDNVLNAEDEHELAATRTSVSRKYLTEARVPPLDLCVMNPPFVRSVGGNLLFGSLADHERARLQTELKKQVKAHGLAASITAGLGSVFLAIAHDRLKVGGRLAFVLPVALATGEAWGASRELLARQYRLEWVIVSHDPARPNFSENTDLSEILFIARKRASGEPAGPTRFVNLWHNPPAIYAAMDLAERIRSASVPTLDDQGVCALRNLDGRPLGEVLELPPADGEAQWLGVQFAQTWTLRAAARLSAGALVVPGQAPVAVPLCRLDSLGALGPDRKRIHEGFKVSADNWSPYPAFWDHKAVRVRTLAQQPNGYLSVWEQSPRGPDYGPSRLWPRAGRLLLVERLRTNTHRVMAVGFDEPVLGNTWWALQTALTAEQEQVLLLWLNSTPALLLLLARRVTTEGAWMQVKQPAWAAMPVLDVRALPAATLATLARAYQRLADEPLEALAKLHDDPIRAAIDTALGAALGWPDLRKLRELLSKEPGLTGNSLSPEPKPTQTELFEPDEAEQCVQLRLF